MLTCSCHDFDTDYAESWWYAPDDFKKLESTRRKRCCSCKKTMIGSGNECLEFRRFRSPRPGIESDIRGEDAEIPIAPLWMCEACGEIYLNLSDVGYCMDITESMHDYLEEYQEMTGFEREEHHAGNL